MTISIRKDQWVWVYVFGPEGKDQILGQQDEKNDIAFIPTFQDKDTALICYNSLAKDKDQKYEAQAVIFEDLQKYAGENGFLIFILNGSGEILEKLTP